VGVLHQLGVAENESPDAAIAAARRLNPKHPGAIDSILWDEVPVFCDASLPNRGEYLLNRENQNHE
jgi:hypothetical protein